MLAHGIRRCLAIWRFVEDGGRIPSHHPRKRNALLRCMFFFLPFFEMGPLPLFISNIDSPRSDNSPPTCLENMTCMLSSCGPITSCRRCGTLTAMSTCCRRVGSAVSYCRFSAETQAHVRKEGGRGAGVDADGLAARGGTQSNRMWHSDRKDVDMLRRRRGTGTGPRRAAVVVVVLVE